MEALLCLWAHSIDDKNGGVYRVRWDRGLSDNDGGVGRGRGIYEASEGSETTTEAARDQRRARGIYDEEGGIGGGQGIDDVSEVSETKTEAARIQGRRRRMRSRNDRPEELATTTEASTE